MYMHSSKEFFKKGLIAEKNEEFNKAKDYYKQAIEIEEKNSMAWNNLGWILYDQEQKYKEALNCYKKSLNSNKNNFYALNNLGIYHYEQDHDYKKAEKCWRDALKINKYFPRAWKNLGYLYKFYKKDIKKANEYYKKAEESQLLARENESISNKMKKIMSAYTKIKKETFKEILNLPDSKFEQIIIDLALKYNFRIDDDMIIFNKSSNKKNVEDAIDDLDAQFRNWNKIKEEKK